MRFHAGHLTTSVPIVSFGLVCGWVHIDMLEVACENSLYTLQDDKGSLRRMAEGDHLLE